jgi:hypothetical protein
MFLLIANDGKCTENNIFWLKPRWIWVPNAKLAKPNPYENLLK